MTYQLIIWCECGVNINIQPYLLFLIICVMSPRTLVPSMTSMGCLTSKLERFPYLATQRRCYVTMTANV